MNIVLKGVMLVFWMFVLIVIYIVTSSPFESMVAGIESSGTSIVQVASTGAVIRVVYNLCFAIAGLIPIIWFVADVFRSEPDWSFNQYE